jgi:hypothetical protein
MLKRILIGLAVVVLAFVGYVALQPSTFRVERSSIVVAPPSAVFAEVNDFHNWEGAVFHWSGNQEVGEGRMTLVESRPDQHIRIRVDFVKPWEGTSASDFTFRPDGPRTIVTWTISGEQTFLEKAVCVFMNMDKTLGGDLEKGLASLKTLAEAKLGERPPE